MVLVAWLSTQCFHLFLSFVSFKNTGKFIDATGGDLHKRASATRLTSHKREVWLCSSWSMKTSSKFICISQKSLTWLMWRPYCWRFLGLHAWSWLSLEQIWLDCDETFLVLCEAFWLDKQVDELCHLKEKKLDQKNSQSTHLQFLPVLGKS